MSQSISGRVTTTLYHCVVCDCFVDVFNRTEYQYHSSGRIHKLILDARKLGNDPNPLPILPDQQIPCKSCNMSVRGDNWRRHENTTSHRETLKSSECCNVDGSMRLYCRICHTLLPAGRTWRKHRLSDNHRIARVVSLKNSCESSVPVRITSADIVQEKAHDSMANSDEQESAYSTLPTINTLESTQPASSHPGPSMSREAIEMTSSTNSTLSSNKDDRPLRAAKPSLHVGSCIGLTQEKRIEEIVSLRLKKEWSLSSSSDEDDDDDNGALGGERASQRANSPVVIVISDSEDEIPRPLTGAELLRNLAIDAQMNVQPVEGHIEAGLLSVRSAGAHDVHDVDIHRQRENYGPVDSSSDTGNEETENETDQLQDDDETDAGADQEETDENRRALDIIIKKQSSQIIRLLGFDVDLDRLVVQGRQCLVADRDGTERQSALSLREIKSFEILCDLVPTLREELVHMSDEEAQAAAAKMKTHANAARRGDIQKAKNNIIKILVHLDEVSEAEGNVLAEKAKRGFKSKLGKMLCPVNLDWDNARVRKGIRKGDIEVVAEHFPRSIYEKYRCDPKDYDKGLLKNKALAHLARLVFTGRRSAFAAEGSLPKTGTNAEIASMHNMTPRAIAYCACLMRFSMSDKESWSLMDEDFDILDYYWNIVGIFDGSELAKGILRWWDRQIFGTKRPKPTKKRPLATLKILQSQREAKRNRTES